MARVTSEVLGKPYQLGGFGNPGFDCLSLVLWFARKVNPALNAEYEGFTTDNYVDLFKSDPDGAKQIMFCWICEIASDVSRYIAGDIIIMSPKTSTGLSTAIYTGNNMLLTVFESRGVSLINAKPYDVVKSLRIKV